MCKRDALSDAIEVAKAKIRRREDITDAIVDGVRESIDAAIRPAMEGGFLFDAIRDGVRDAFCDLLHGAQLEEKVSDG